MVMRKEILDWWVMVKVKLEWAWLGWCDGPWLSDWWVMVKVNWSGDLRWIKIQLKGPNCLDLALNWPFSLINDGSMSLKNVMDLIPWNVQFAQVQGTCMWCPRFSYPGSWLDELYCVWGTVINQSGNPIFPGWVYLHDVHLQVVSKRSTVWTN